MTPANAAAVPDFLEQMWALGVPWVRVTPVVVTGAAARGGDWQISDRALEEAVGRVQASGTARRCRIVAAAGHRRRRSACRAGRRRAATWCAPTATCGPTRCGRSASATRPATGSRPAGRRSAKDWDDERINRWADSMKRPEDLPKSDLVAYLDDEVPVAGEPGTGRLRPRRGKGPGADSAASRRPGPGACRSPGESQRLGGTAAVQARAAALERE